MVKYLIFLYQIKYHFTNGNFTKNVLKNDKGDIKSWLWK